MAGRREGVRLVKTITPTSYLPAEFYWTLLKIAARRSGKNKAPHGSGSRWQFLVNRAGNLTAEIG